MSPSDSTHSATAPEQDEPLRRSLRLVFVAWFFGAVWASIISGAALTRYAKLVHLPLFGFGLLSALSFGSALVQLVSSYFLERTGRHKALFIIAGVTHRLLWIVIALVPWVFPPPWWWPAFLVCKLVTDIATNVGGPAWYTWMADLVPRRLRGRFFGRRNQAGLVVQLATTLVLGLVLDWAMAQGDEFLLKVISLALTVAAVSGAIDFLFFIPVPGPRAVVSQPDVSIVHIVAQPFKNPNFRRLLGFSGTLTFAAGFLGPFVWLYLFDVAGMSNTMATVVLVVVPTVVAMFAQVFWGHMIDRYGRKPILVIATCLIIHGAVVWLLVTNDHWVVGLVIVQLATFAWTGIDLASFNMLLGMSEAGEGRRYGTAYSAVSSVITALAGILSGLFGGAIAETFKDWHGMWFGIPVTYHAIIFAVSSGLRVFALFWLPGMKDEGAFHTRDSLRYIAADMYSSLLQIAVLPVRLVRHMGRVTYRVFKT